MTIDERELDELRVKLAELKLSDNQRLLLDKILKIAWDHVVVQHQLDIEFEGSFSPAHAAAIMAYPASIRDHIVFRKDQA